MGSILILFWRQKQQRGECGLELIVADVNTHFPFWERWGFCEPFKNNWFIFFFFPLYQTIPIYSSFCVTMAVKVLLKFQSLLDIQFSFSYTIGSV